MSFVAAGSEQDQIQADRVNTITFAKKRARYRKDTLQKHAAYKSEELQQICRSLLRLTQRYVPSSPNTFSDYLEVVQCTKVLQKIGVSVDVATRFAAVIEGTGNEIITNSSDYRYLKNKCIAGFATIADLTEKPAAVGSPEFQRGVREGYRRASDIAVLFLEDIQSGEKTC